MKLMMQRICGSVMKMRMKKKMSTMRMTGEYIFFLREFVVLPASSTMMNAVFTVAIGLIEPVHLVSFSLELSMPESVTFQQ